MNLTASDICFFYVLPTCLSILAIALTVSLVAVIVWGIRDAFSKEDDDE